MSKLGRARTRLSLSEAIGQAVACHRRGDLVEAEKLYNAVLKAQPDQFDALRLLGVLRYQQQRFADALRLIAAALRSNARSAAALGHHGLILAALGRRDEALASYDQALLVNSHDVDVLNNRGNLLQVLGRYDEACASYDRVLAVQPRHADALGNRGNALRAHGRHDEALASYDRALSLVPGHVDALYNRGSLLVEDERFADALASFGPLLAIRPDHAPAFNGKAAALIGLGRCDEALACCDKAHALNPRHAGTLANRARALLALERPDAALASCDDALAIDPRHVAALNVRGDVLQALGRLPEALASYDQVIATDSRNADAFNNRGTALVAAGRPQDALASYDTAIALRTDFADARFNRAMVRLCLGDFRGGWPDYEWRWRSGDAASFRRDFPQPSWSGEGSLEGRTILLHAEQGLGDTIQFVRYAPVLARRGARVVLEVQPPLAALLRDIDGVAAVVSRGDPLPHFDMHCPLLSLPFACRTEIESIPPAPRLAAAPDRIAQWRQRLAGGTRRIGIVWAGRAQHRNDANRSVPLGALAPLLARPGIVSLQRELREGDADVLARHPGLLRLGEEFGDFADTAAVIAQLDCVISADTSVAHLAGAMGKPVWILIPFVPDFRWMLEREDSPWYPGARLFRQSRPGDWDGVVRRVAQALDAP